MFLLKAKGRPVGLSIFFRHSLNAQTIPPGRVIN